MNTPKDEPIQIEDRRKQDWIWIDNRILDRYATHIGPHGFVLYVALLYFAHDPKPPDLAQLCRATHMSPNRVRKAWDALEHYQLARRVRDDAGTITDDYQLLPIK